jgi:hypothetical protein
MPMNRRKRAVAEAVKQQHAAEAPNPESQSLVAAADPIASYVMPLGQLARSLDCPLSTLDKLRMQGRGPITLLIGRRLYVKVSDAYRWIDRLADHASDD